MLGSASIALTTDLDMHARLRQHLSASFTKDAILHLLPQLQQTAAVHLTRWAAATAPSGSSNRGSASVLLRLATTADGSMLLGYPAARLLTFDVLVNNVFGLQMSDQEVQQYEALFKDLIGGFVPPAWDVPFTPYGKGVKARWVYLGLGCVRMLPLTRQLSTALLPGFWQQRAYCLLWSMLRGGLVHVASDSGLIVASFNLGLDAHGHVSATAAVCWSAACHLSFTCCLYVVLHAQAADCCPCQPDTVEPSLLWCPSAPARRVWG
jgi:hypothetical protein